MSHHGYASEFEAKKKGLKKEKKEIEKIKETKRGRDEQKKNREQIEISGYK